MKFGGHTPLKACNQTFFQLHNLRSRAIAGQDDLFPQVGQTVEGVKELALQTVLASKKLDIVDQEEIRFPVFFAKRHEGVGLNRINVIVGEFLRRNVKHFGLRTLFQSFPANRMKQVSFAESGRGVEKQGLIGAARRI